ncbi:MAG: hypothetical protein FWC56_05600, partial [Phycisphaerae bacterium]|nr:hypothetical protein [Phycisphaerae bacterium]
MNRLWAVVCWVSVGSGVWAASVAASTVVSPAVLAVVSPAAATKTPSFQHGRPIIGTTYFYGYDIYSGAQIRNADGTEALTHHPPATAM